MNISKIADKIKYKLIELDNKDKTKYYYALILLICALGIYFFF